MATNEGAGMSDLADRLRKAKGLDLDLKQEAADEIDRLNELREQDGRAMGLLIEGYNKMQALCIDGKYLTDEERQLLNNLEDWYAKTNREEESRTVRGLLDRLEHGRHVSSQQTLTAAECAAVADAAERYAEVTPESAETAATLRCLLERMKVRCEK
jgi:hypothetical protein